MSDVESPTPYRELAAVIEALPLLVREARRARGLSIRGAAKRIGLSFSTVRRLETGEGLNSENTAAILRWLDQTEQTGATDE